MRKRLQHNIFTNNIDKKDKLAIMKKLLFTLAIGLAILTSCESDLVSAPPSDSINDGVLLKRTIETSVDGSTFIIDYTYDGNKLVSIVDSDGYSENYTYTGGLITRVDEFESGVLDSYITYEYDSSDRLIKSTISFSGGSEQVAISTYNSDGTITEVIDAISEFTHTYTGSNRVSYEGVTDGFSFSFTYDDKNGPLKNVLGFLEYSKDSGFADSFRNNTLSSTQITGVTSSSFSDEFTNSYTYNSANYPVLLTHVGNLGTASEETTTTEFFYE